MKGSAKRVIRRIGRILIFAFVGLMVLLALIAGATQTQAFRNYLRSFALRQLDTLLLAHVELGELKGNLVSGFSIDSILVQVDGVDIVRAERLDLRYDLFGIPGKAASFSTVRLVKPTITLLGNRNGSWNFERIVHPTQGDSTSSPFDWTIAIETMEMLDATIVLADSLRPETGNQREFFDYHRFSLHAVNLKTSAHITPDRKELYVSSFSCMDPQDDLEVRRLQGDFIVSRSGARVDNFRLKTARSSLALDAAIQDIDLLRGIRLEDLGRKPVELALRSEGIETGELKKLLAELNFLHGTVWLDLKADGVFGNVAVHQLNIGTGSTNLHFSGGLKNLERPENLLLNVQLTEGQLNPHDALVLMPDFHLPDYSSLGNTRLSLEFQGTPSDFQTKFYWETAAGILHSSGFDLAVGGTAGLRYKGEVFAEGLNLATVLTNPGMTSTLNAMAAIDGEGTTFDALNSHLRVVIDSSNFMGQRMESTQLIIDARNRKVTSSIVTVIGPLRTVLNGQLDKSKPGEPTFTLQGDVHSLDLSRFLSDKSYDSDLSLSMTLAGRGLTWDRLSGDFSLGFLSSRFRQYKIESGDVRVHLEQDNPSQKVLAITSNIADISLKGSFNTDYIAALIEYETGNIKIALGEKFASFDSSLTSSVDRVALEKLSAELAAYPDSLDVEYSLHVKNIEPLSIITSDRQFNARGVMNGRMRGGFHDLSVNGTLVVEDFFYGNVEGGILLQNGSAVFDASSLKPVDPMRDLAFHLESQAEKVHLNRMPLDSVRCSFTYQQERSSYAGSAIADHDTRLSLQGLARGDSDQVLFTPNSLHVGYQDFRWSADDGASVWFSTRGVQVSNLVMRRDSQSVALEGFVGVDGELEAALTVENLDLAVLDYFLSKEDLRQRREAFAGNAHFSLTAGGSLGDPTYHLGLTADNVSFRKIPLGRVVGTFGYASRVLTGDLKVTEPVQSDSARTRLLVNGNIPIDLSLADGEGLPPVEESMNIAVQSDGVQMNILDPLLAPFTDLQGIMKCNLKIGGSPEDPTYKGIIRIDSCSFLFVPNNIPYTFEGIFQPEGDRINVLTATIRNLGGKTVPDALGEVKLKGDFALKDFKPTDFNLTATGKLLVVKRETRASSLSVYGNLFVEFEQGLTYTGSFDRSLLAGAITVRNSSLVFPPTEESTEGKSQYYFPFVLLRDTTAVADTLSQSAALQYFGEQDSTRARASSVGYEESKSFLDGVRYNLDITATGGSTTVQFVFDAQRDERLEAAIEGNLNISGEGKRWIGRLRVPKAFYNSLSKRFDATGEIVFAGDYLNPELDISATYQGTRTLDLQGERKTENIVVTMKISGNRNKPLMIMSMTIDGKDYEAYNGPKSGDLQNDAIIYILSGTFGTTESTRSVVSSNIGTAAGTAVVSGATSLLTGKLSEFLRTETGFINAIEFRYGAGESFSESADIRVSATVYKGLVNFGGRIFESFDNSYISLLYSLGDLFSKPALRNFMVEFERKVDRGGGINSSTDRNEVKSARLFYRFSF